MPCKIVGGTKVPGNEKSRERKFLGTKGPGNESSQESSREPKGPGTKVLGNFRSQRTKVPGNEKSPERKFPIGTIRSWERKVLGTKSPSTMLCHPACAHHRKTLSSACLPSVLITLMAIWWLFPPALLQTGCVYAAGLQRSRWYRHEFPEPVPVSGMCTGSRAVAKPASGWLLRVPDTGAGTRAGYHATDNIRVPVY